MSGLPLIVQVLIVVGVFIPALIIAVRIAKTGGSGKVGSVSFTLGQLAKNDSKLCMSQDCVTEKLITVRQVFFSSYLKLLKDAGCPEEILVENEDAEFVNQCLGNIVFSGNGIKSTKSIIEKALLDKTFLKLDYSDLMEYLINASKQNAQKYINDHYHTMVRLPDGSQRERLVSNTEWVDSLVSTMQQIRPILEDVMRFSRSLYKQD